MSRRVLARTGMMGEVGVFRVTTPHRFARDARAISRTARGLEVATVLCDSPGESSIADRLDGELLRPLTPNDELILERLERHRDRAWQACQRLIDERGLPVVLMDVEHLFDGESLYFHFLGPCDESTQSLLDELAALYEKRVGFRQFVERLVDGCGPGCGTTASRCGSACGTCSAGGCGAKK